MAVAEDQDQLEKHRVEQFIAESPSMAGLDRISVEFGDDQSGDPALWLVFHLAPKGVVDKHWARRSNEYAATIQTSILHSEIKRFPYTRLESVS